MGEPARRPAPEHGTARQAQEEYGQDGGEGERGGSEGEAEDARPQELVDEARRARQDEAAVDQGLGAGLHFIRRSVSGGGGLFRKECRLSGIRRSNRAPYTRPSVPPPPRAGPS